MPKYRAHSTEFKPPCQVGGRRTHLLPSLPIARSRSGNTSDAGDITPSLKGTITGSSMAACDQKVATKLEEVVDLAVAGEEPPSRSRTGSRRTPTRSSSATLPSCAPDHNPDEYLNHDLEQQLRQKPQPGCKEELIQDTRAVLRAIQRLPDRIKSYFTPEPVRYAA